MSNVQLGAADGAAPPGGTNCHDSKLAGLPDWPPLQDPQFDNKCDLCNLPRPLVLQCYAPFDGSPYHRTLYVHACINPNCWNKSESWSCIRVQYKDKEEKASYNSIEEKSTLSSSNMWCNDADDWEVGEASDDLGIFCELNNPKLQQINENDEAMEEISTDFENMKCTNVHSRLHELKRIANIVDEPSAEIENEDCSNISIEAPIIPTTNIRDIFDQKPSIPETMRNTIIEFKSMYIRVFPEYLNDDIADKHINDLLLKYQQQNPQSEKEMKSQLPNKPTGKSKNEFIDEEYEKGKPLHGDMSFHSFNTRIKINPEQIIRYSLGDQPLLISEMPIHPKSIRCQRCSGEKQFEVQILPTAIPLLRIEGSQETHLEFGNVIVYTCKSSCWREEDKFAKETIVVQPEPV